MRPENEIAVLGAASHGPAWIQKTEQAFVAITVRRERGQRQVVVVISGVLDAAAVPSLSRALLKLLRTRAPILIDLTQATSIHRDGLALLVAAHRQAERNGRSLLLRIEPTQIRALLAAFALPPEDPR